MVVEPDVIYGCFIPVVIFGSIFAVIYVIRLLMPADAFIKRRTCPVCSGKNSGLLVDERRLGMFQKVTSSDHSSLIRRRRPIQFGWFEKYELTYNCEVCGYQWTASDVRKA